MSECECVSLLWCQTSPTAGGWVVGTRTRTSAYAATDEAARAGAVALYPKGTPLLCPHCHVVLTAAGTLITMRHGIALKADEPVHMAITVAAHVCRPHEAADDPLGCRDAVGALVKAKWVSVRETALHELAITRVCACCKKRSDGKTPRFQVCARCERVHYCTRECQRAAWREHKKYCSVVATTK